MKHWLKDTFRLAGVIIIVFMHNFEWYNISQQMIYVVC